MSFGRIHLSGNPTYQELADPRQVPVLLSSEQNAHQVQAKMNKFVITGLLLFSSAQGLTIPRNQPRDIDGMVELLIGAFVILSGIFITKVGLRGQHLGQFKLVSNVKKHPEPPRRHHRLITAGVGITFVLLGLAILIFQFVFLPLKYAPHS